MYNQIGKMFIAQIPKTATLFILDAEEGTIKKRQVLT